MRKLELIPQNTYRTEVIAEKKIREAIEDACNGCTDGVRYIIQKTEDGRYFPVTIFPQDKIQEGIWLSHKGFPMIG